MSRRILSVVVAALMLFGLLPANAAFAQANATATLTGNAVTFPGEKTYTVQVTNNETNVLGIGGRTINAVQIFLPAHAAGVSFNGTPSTSGWTSKVTSFNNGTTQYVTYRGGTIAPGASATFSIPTTVRRPLRSDLTGDFIVKVSSNDFQTSNNNASVAQGGTLTTAVEVLEILDNTLKPIRPTNADNTKGVTDGTATAGQTVTYGFDVRNHAQEAINVTGSLVAAAPESPGAAALQSVAGSGGVTRFEVPLTLGPSAVGDRTAGVSARAVSAAADAAPRNSVITIQQPVNLELSGLTPTRVRSGFGSAREFSLNARKTGTPAFDMTAGALRFGQNTAQASQLQNFGSGTQNTTLRYAIAEITGADGELAANATTAGTDHNLMEYALSAGVGLITIDTSLPQLTLDLPVLGTAGKDADGDELVAAANGTKITVSGVAKGTNDLNLSTLKVQLVPDTGNPINVPVSTTDNGDGTYNFTGSVSGTAVSWAPAATRFIATATLEDQAGNLGVGDSLYRIVDTALPVLDPDAGVVQSPTTIRVQFDDATGLRGACDPRLWRIDGTPGRVVDVLTSEGKSCYRDATDEAAGSANARARALSVDGVRTLVLDASRPLGWDETPDVTYDRGIGDAYVTLGIYRAKDGARNFADNKTISTITDLVPPMPDLSNVRRPDHETGQLEAITPDAEDGKYYTNVGGDQAITAVVHGVRNGYTIQVRNAAGDVVASYPAQRPQLLSPLATEWTQEIKIPLGTGDASYTRKVRLLSSVGNASPDNILGIVLDTVRPTIGSSVLTGDGEGLAHFNEKVPFGNKSTLNWIVTWVQTHPELGPAEVGTTVEEVHEFNTDWTVRRFLFAEEVNGTNFRRIDYYHQDSSKFEDRAGNYLVDSLVTP